MQEKYETLLEIGTGILGGIGLYYFLRKYHMRKKHLSKSIDNAVESGQFDLNDAFGDVPYVPMRV